MSPKKLPFPFGSAQWPQQVQPNIKKRHKSSTYDAPWSRKYPARLARAIILDGLTRPVIKLLADPKIIGIENILGLKGPAIFAANHTSHLDTPLLISVLPEQFRHKTVVAAGADYFFDKRWKAILSSFSIAAVPMERTKVSRRSAQLAAKLINEGWSLAIFPEGGRTPDGWMKPFRGGAAYLSEQCNVPVVPVYLEATGEILPKGSKRIHLASVTVNFGTILYPQGDMRAYASRIETEIATLADEVASDWWSAKLRSAKGLTPDPGGPQAAPWRRSWSLGPPRRLWRGRKKHDWQQ